ncbi:MAG: flagellar hook-length control protein FliK, partial [Bdellovibrionales bacterium]|nr:flagellar hook-length control protein FliK [Bdellovibrionales bacterium]
LTTKTEDFASKPMLRSLERVEDALKEAAKARDGRTISLRLDPPSLGKVRVDVTMRENHLHARIMADSQQVAQFLRDRSFELQSALRKLGLNLEDATVSVFTTGDESSQSNSNQDDGSRDSDTSHDWNNTNPELSQSSSQVNEVKPQVDDHWIA